METVDTRHSILDTVRGVRRIQIPDAALLPSFDIKAQQATADAIRAWEKNGKQRVTSGPILVHHVCVQGGMARYGSF